MRLRAGAGSMSGVVRARIEAAARGANPALLRRLPEGYAVLGDPQFLPGYCLLLTDDPSVCRLSDLPPDRRTAFLASMTTLAEAVERACAEADPAFRRVNLEILGNTDPLLHAHVWPRYEWEPADRLSHPVWLYPRERWTDPATAVGPQHQPLREALLRHLADLSAAAASQDTR